MSSPPHSQLPSQEPSRQDEGGAKTSSPAGPSVGQQSTFSPSTSMGPLSPSANPSSSFIFPIRSVFQGMNASESHSSIASDGGPLRRIVSGTTSVGAQSPSGQSERRISQSFAAGLSDPSGDDVAGIQTIEQMLQQGHGGGSGVKRERPSGAGTALFRGKGDRYPTLESPKAKQSDSRSRLHRSRPSQSSIPRSPPTPRSPPEGFFSMPILQAKETKESLFFAEKRDPEHGSVIDRDGDVRMGNSDGDRTNSDETTRQPQNASATTQGNGLPDPGRAPVGQPQVAPTSSNFVDYPNPSEDSPFISNPSMKPSRNSADPGTQNVDIRQPEPVSVSKVAGLEHVAGTSPKKAKRNNITDDDDGGVSVVNDISGIIRLADLTSLPSTYGATSGSGSAGQSSKNQRGSGGAMSAQLATAARLAQQERGNLHAGDHRDSVQSFVSEQSRTVNFPDPNAPTPSPAPMSQADALRQRLETIHHDGEPTASAHRPTVEEYSGGSGTDSDFSLSVRDSSEMATASGEGTETGDEEPVVTFRFEHVGTADGHHVVVGREGKLERCEDEPITTPGAVQGFGVLMVLEQSYDDDSLTNATELLGLPPKYLFRLDCFTRLLSESQEDILRDNIEYLPDSASGRQGVEEEGPQVFLLTGYGAPGTEAIAENDDDVSMETPAPRRKWTCWVAAHRPKTTLPSAPNLDENGKPVTPPDLIILEFELEKDVYNPISTNPPADDESIDGGSTSDGQATPSGESAGFGDSLSAGRGSLGSATTVGTTPRLMASERSESTIGKEPGNAERPPLSRTGSRSTSKKFAPIGLEGLDVEHPLERILESTTNHAKPLRALERMRRSAGEDRGRPGRGGRGRRGARAARSGGAPGSTTEGTLDVFAVLGQINDQLGQAADLEAFLKVTVGVVQDLSRFHRVLIYQFDESMNGQVVSELVEWGKTTDLFKGLMFPAADIPAQARELYKINKVRLLYDRSQTTARMVLKSKEDLDTPLDMTHCYLRAMSPIHIKYLANMGVRSSMSVSIMAFGQLWGLIACHGYGHAGMRVSFPVRQMMRILSDSISRNIERLSYAQRLHSRKLISTIPTQSHPTGYIVSNADDLLQIFDADAGLLVIGDGCKLLGQSAEQGQAMLAISEYLRIMKFDNMKASHHIAADFPDLMLPRSLDAIAGMLYVPLSAKAGQDFIVLLRKGQAKEVQWAGKPYKDEQSNTDASLEPRKSFRVWSETVTGRSRAWTDDQLESAGVLALIYGKFIQVWREKQTAMASNQLTAILLSNTSHAVRTPLSQIINTLELALSGNIDNDTRSMLENSHQASRALLFHVHDLLDLTRIETGNETAFNDPFDLKQTISDAVRLYQTESQRRGLEFRVTLAPNLPQFVIGDSRKIKTVISNLVANSVKFTAKGHIEVYCGLKRNNTDDEVAKSGYVPIEIVVSDTGCGISTDKLQAMFVSLEGVEEGRPEGTGLGLGLAVVARIVEQLAGQLRAESEVSVGSRFFFTLSMLVHNGRTASRSSGSSISRRGSSGASSAVSLHSGQSRASEIDTFVNEFASSHMITSNVIPPGVDRRLAEAEARMNKPGTFPVTDSSYPIRPSRMDPEGENAPATSPQLPSTATAAQRPALQASQKRFGRGSNEMLRIPFDRSPPPPHVTRSKRGPKGEQRLRVLVVEDDLINSLILQKRLKMDKHVVIAVNNGQEAVDALRRDWDIDVVLMDIQMPIMDGKTAAKEIRKCEATLSPRPDIDPLRIDGRIPIFAVSASLYESDRDVMEVSFDGWLLKPLDFARVRVLLRGLEDGESRNLEVYQQGHWEKGGYFKAPAPVAAPETPILFAKDPMSVHRRAVVPPPIEEDEEPCLNVCGLKRVEGATSEREALCSVDGLRATYACAECIDTAWPDTTWEDSAIAEYDRIASACDDGPDDQSERRVRLDGDVGILCTHTSFDLWKDCQTSGNVVCVVDTLDAVNTLKKTSSESVPFRWKEVASMTWKIALLLLVVHSTHLRKRCGFLLIPTSTLMRPHLAWLVICLPCEWGMGQAQKDELKEETRALFVHGYEGYMRYAYPADELRPLSCKPLGRSPDPNNFGINDIHANVSITLLDVLSTLPLIHPAALPRALEEITTTLSFDQNVKVQVFEMTIRALGALLSTYQYLENLPEDEVAQGERLGLGKDVWGREKKVDVRKYRHRIFELALDLGERLLPAFETTTGIPYARVNLRHGVEKGESVDTCLAGAGSLILEFAVLSRLTGDERFETSADKAYLALWNRRSTNNLLGNSIGVSHGHWLAPGLSGVGAGMDSFFEYGIKAGVLLGDDAYMDIFQDAYAAVQTHVRTSDGFIYRPTQFRLLQPAARSTIDSLSAFLPSIQVMAGDIESAIKGHLVFWNLWRKYSAIPESWAWKERQIEWTGWPGRPEFIESTYYLYRATKDPFYLRVGERVLNDIKRRVKTRCGFATMKNVETGELEDRMESFVLSETLKYLYLLFDTSPLSHSNSVFTTEGHPLSLPVSLLRQPSEARRQSHRGESLTCPPYKSPTLGGLVVGIEQRADYEYARTLVFGPSDIGVSIEDEARVHWSESGFCAVPVVPRFSFDIVLSPSNTSHSEEVPKEDPSPPSSKVYRDEPTGDFVISDIDGLRLGVRWRFDGRGYDVSSIGPHRVRPGQDVLVTDPKMAGYLPVAAPPPAIPFAPAEAMLRFAVTLNKNTEREVFLHALGATAMFGKDLGRDGNGPGWGFNGKSVALIKAEASNPNGCLPFAAPPASQAFVLAIERGGCTFIEKAVQAGRIGALGILIVGIDPSESPSEERFFDEGLIRPSAEGESAETMALVKDIGVVYVEHLVGDLVFRAMEEGDVDVELLRAEDDGLGRDGGKKWPDGRHGKVVVGEWEILNLKVIEKPP
ncbi:hypothetical protein P7C73_g1006, partial [Tremellales sp. Uapishka_1]